MLTKICSLLQKEKNGKTVFFSLDNTLAVWIKANENVLDALAFYQMAEVFGIVGNELSEQLDHPNRSFRVKHNFFVHTLEDEILLALLDAMRRKSAVELTIKGVKNKTVVTASCIPLSLSAGQ